MNRRIPISIVMLITGIAMLNAQSIQHPWWVVDRGGGESSAPGGFGLIGSFGQTAVQRMTQSDTGLVLESGYVPGVRNFSGTTMVMRLPIGAGWNMVSVPLLLTDYDKDTCYPTATSLAYRYAHGYDDVDTLENGVGYWLKFAEAQSVQMAGTGILVDSIEVSAGWNMIGMISYPVLASDVNAVPPTSILSPFYGFLPWSGYGAEDTLKPGQSYWVKVDSAGTVVLQPGSVPGSPGNLLADGSKKVSPWTALKERVQKHEISSFTVRDAQGKERRLYFSTLREDLEVETGELPPPPPSGIMDVRFRTQRAVETYDVRGGGEQAFPIQVTEAIYPLTVVWDLAEEGGGYTLETVSSDGTHRSHQLQGNGTLVIENAGPADMVLRMKGEAAPNLPTEFALDQNYPNPFNPKTTVRYALPADTHVSLTIYNILGQEVATLVDEVQKAGYRSVSWNAPDVGSGTYFYRLQARLSSSSVGGQEGSYVAVRKMLLVK